MLSSLSIKNFGLIEELSINFSEALNVFTGATGAGKSILIDALNYSLGKKINTSNIRKIDIPCQVEAVFDLSNKNLKDFELLSDYIDPAEPVLIIKRIFTPDGKNKNYINGGAVTTAQLKEIGNHLVDFHGPHDHQMLFSENYHMEILDRLSDIDNLKKEYALLYSNYNLIKNKLHELRCLSDMSEHELDLITSKIKELEQVALTDTEYDELLIEQTRLNNAERLYAATIDLIDILSNEESGISSTISNAFKPINTLNGMDSSTSNMLEILERMQEDSSDLIYTLNNYIESISFDPEKAFDINKRFDSYSEILRKYGPTVEDARISYEKLKTRFELIANIEHNDLELTNKLAETEKSLRKIADKMTTVRKKTSLDLKKTIEKELVELGIKHVCFECRIDKTELNSNGHDKAIFFISPNAGEELKPLAEIVSSGEAARVMLALKKALTEVDPVPVLIFDEIDAQIGGRMGTITGKKLKELSANRQVILITHLPQIASFGNYHFTVIKSVQNNRTITDVKLLEKDARIEELANMMEGDKKSKISIEHARHMLESASKS